MYITVTPATFPVVSSTDLNAWLRLNDSVDDGLLSGMVSAAEDLFTRHTGHVLASKTMRLLLDGYPAGGIIYLARTPVSAVSAVEYLDADGTWQTLSCTTDADSVPARVILPTSRPTLHVTQRPRLRVTFTAGYASASSIPSAALVAVKLLAAHWYNRGIGTGGAFSEAELFDLPIGWKGITAAFDNGVRGDWNGVRGDWYATQ